MITLRLAQMTEDNNDDDEYGMCGERAGRAGIVPVPNRSGSTGNTSPS